MSMNVLAKLIHDNSRDKGFYDDETKLHEAVETSRLTLQEKDELHAIVTRLVRNEKLLLVISEVIEVVEAIRKNKGNEDEEMADAIIRLLDLCGYDTIDIDKEVTAKMDVNKGRERKHGVRF